MTADEKRLARNARRRAKRAMQSETRRQTLVIIEATLEGLRRGHSGRVVREGAHFYATEKGGLIPAEKVNQLVTWAIKSQRPT